MVLLEFVTAAGITHGIDELYKAGADYKDDDDKLDGYPYDVPDYA